MKENFIDWAIDCTNECINNALARGDMEEVYRLEDLLDALYKKSQWIDLDTFDVDSEGVMI